jgi:hypothetical protein
MSEADRQQAIVRFVKAASEVYRISVPEVGFAPNTDFYFVGQIWLSEASSITAWHEFRHHWQLMTGSTVADVEDDARGWSLSLLHSVAPKTLRRLAREDRVLHLDARMKNRDGR